jgi:hypothetical protein
MEKEIKRRMTCQPMNTRAKSEIGKTNNGGSSNGANLMNRRVYMQQ